LLTAGSIAVGLNTLGSTGLSSNVGASDKIRMGFIGIGSRGIPLCSLEEGHRSISFAHLANIALAVGKRVQWDPDKELFTNSDEANKMLHYEYRKPWILNS
jgi:hypothetical protein